MGHQQVFLSLMGDIIDEKIILMDEMVEDFHDKLQYSCEMLGKIVDKGELMLENDGGFEFLPFCCTGGDEAKFDFVWVGMNPGIAKGRWPKRFYWDRTKWQDMVDFYIPKGKVSEYNNKRPQESTNIYQWIAEDGVWSDFYRLMIRIHFALLGNREYGTWKDLQDACGDDKKVSKAFLKQLDTYPTLNAELIPFKSNEIKINAGKMVENSKYMLYLNNLLKFIDDNTKKDAWVFFFATTEVVTRLLKEQKAVKIEIADKPISVEPKKNNGKKISGGKYFYFQYWGERKLILSPFLQAYHDNGKDVSALIGKIKEYFKC